MELVNYFKSPSDGTIRGERRLVHSFNLLNWMDHRWFVSYLDSLRLHSKTQKWGILYHYLSCYFKINGAFRLRRSPLLPLIPHTLIIIKSYGCDQVFKAYRNLTLKVHFTLKTQVCCGSRNNPDDVVGVVLALQTEGGAASWVLTAGSIPDWYISCTSRSV